MKTKATAEETVDRREYVVGVRKQKDEDGKETDLWEGGCSCRTVGDTYAGPVTSGWALKRLAEERMEQHLAEHMGEDPVELHDFRVSHGLVPSAPETPAPFPVEED